MNVRSKPISMRHLVAALATGFVLIGIAVPFETRAGNIGTTCTSYHHHHCAQSADPGRSSARGGNVGATSGGTADRGPQKIVRDDRAKGAYYSPTYRPVVRDHRSKPVVRDHRSKAIVRDHRTTERHEGRPHR